MNRTRSVGIVLATAIVVGGAFAAFRFSTQRNQQTQPADLVLRGGRIVTLDDNASEVQALAVRDGRIVAIGSNADIAGYIGSSTQVIDIQFAMPGFIEGHEHFTGIGAVVVLGHPAYYPRFGFSSSARYGIGCEYDVPEEVFMVVEVHAGFLHGASGTVRYHAAFGACQEER